MKKLVLTFAALALCAAAYAQDAVEQAAADAALEISQAPKEEPAPVKPKYWTNSLTADLGLTTTQLVNWAAGGYNATTLKAAVDGQANYKKDLMSWNNRLQLDYGFIISADKPDLIQKNADRIYLESKWAYKTGENSNFSYSAAYSFRSQFSDSKDEYAKNAEGKWDGTLKSSFLSPAYTDLSLGIVWNPSSWITMGLSPLTGSFTICTNELLRPNYGMTLLTGEGVTPAKYSEFIFQLGAKWDTNIKLVINDVLKYETQLIVFTDYLNEPYFRVNWDNAINWQLSKLLKLSFKTWLIYDPLVLINGEKKVQFKDFLTFNLTYTIASKK